MGTAKPVVLCILDGWGLRRARPANAPALAATPVFDRLIATCPSARLITHGPDVGLPAGQMGNSEVGHMNIGAGRVVETELVRIDNAIADGSFRTNPALRAFITALRATGGTAHLMGLVSDGGVHGHTGHARAAIAALGQAGIPVAFHAITDGRDVAPATALSHLRDLERDLPETAVIATVSGRYFAMDRDNRWERVALAHAAMIRATGLHATDAHAAVRAAIDRGESDEFIRPTVLPGHKAVQAGDGFFCLNFRADRARQLLRAIAEPGFSAFDTGPRPALAAILGMAEYSKALKARMGAMFPKQQIVNTLGAWVAKHGLRQFRLAETEKYAHVTFFLNGGREPPEPGEDRFMPASPRVATYDLRPEMSAVEVTEAFVAAIGTGYDLIVTNYANPDMVGHTGDLSAAIRACEAVDKGLAQVVPALEQAGGAMILTADHGNCETMTDPETGGPHTAHTTNPVPVVLFGGPGGARLHHGRLADLAPTVLDLMGLPKPAEMTGESLIRR